MRAARLPIAVAVGWALVFAQVNGCNCGPPECQPACDGGSVCTNGACITDGGHDGGGLACVPACDTGYVCSGTTCVADPAPAVCPPSPVIVSGGLIGPATAPTGCQRPVKPTNLPANLVQWLGAVNVGQSVAFSIPSGTGTVSIVSQRLAGASVVQLADGTYLDNSVWPALITAPDGGSWTLQSSPNPEQNLMWTASNTTSPDTTAFPATARSLGMTRDAGVGAGTWKLTLFDTAYEALLFPSLYDGGSSSGLYDVKVLRKGLTQSSAALDIGLYLVADQGINSAAAVNDVSVQRFVGILNQIYGQVGVCIRSVVIYDVPAWARTRYGGSVDVGGPCSDYFQMFTMSQGDAGIPLFLVSDMTASFLPPGATLLGLAASLPGPTSVPGTTASGVGLNSDELRLGTANCGATFSPTTCGADHVAMIAAHEMGHFLGLFHLTEYRGNQFDPLSDTPRCDCVQCATDAGVCSTAAAQMTPSLCNNTKPGCGGSNNLMFWTLVGAATALLPSQGEVVRGSFAAH